MDSGRAMVAAASFDGGCDRDCDCDREPRPSTSTTKIETNATAVERFIPPLENDTIGTRCSTSTRGCHAFGRRDII
jgi:hypothetical protein